MAEPPQLLHFEFASLAAMLANAHAPTFSAMVRCAIVRALLADPRHLHVPLVVLSCRVERCVRVSRCSDIRVASRRKLDLRQEGLLLNYSLKQRGS
jgi:hypothetical protein